LVIVVIDHADCPGVMSMALNMPMLYDIMRSGVKVKRREATRN
jgi:hypothetical protein